MVQPIFKTELQNAQELETFGGGLHFAVFWAFGIFQFGAPA